MLQINDIFIYLQNQFLQQKISDAILKVKKKKWYVENSIKKIRDNKLIPAKTKAPVSKILITNLVNTELMNLKVR